MEEVASSLWSPEEVDLSINARELLAVERGLLSFQALLVSSTVSVFVDSVTAVAYLRKHGGTHSSTLNAIAQRILLWAEPFRIVLAPQFIMGRDNVLADTLSRPNQILGSEWTLKMEVFRDLHLISRLTMIRVPWGWTHSSRIGTVFRLTPSFLGR